MKKAHCFTLKWKQLGLGVVGFARGSQKRQKNVNPPVAGIPSVLPPDELSEQSALILHYTECILYNTNTECIYSYLSFLAYFLLIDR